jgi:hypothetical protein
VLGEYTAFLATEGSKLDDFRAMAAACQDNLSTRALAVRSGLGAVNQAGNLWAMKQQVAANPRNEWLDSQLKPVETTTVQQVCDRAFLQRGMRWIDGNSVLRQQLEPDERVEVGSAAYFALATRLAAQNRVGVLSLHGEILLDVDGKNILIQPQTQTLPVETIR